MAGREKLLGAIGVVTTGLGLALLVVPGLIGTLGPIGLVIEAVDAFDGKILVLLAGLGVTAYVVLVARSRPAPGASSGRPRSLPLGCPCSSGSRLKAKTSP